MNGQGGSCMPALVVVSATFRASAAVRDASWMNGNSEFVIE